MKHFLIYSLSLLLLLTITRPAYAWTHCGTPEAEKDCYVTASPDYSPTAVPSPDVSATPSATALGSVVPTSSPTSEREQQSSASTTVSDSRSDGLGCSIHDCSGNKIPEAVKSLPSTGGIDWNIIVFAAYMAGIGITLKKHATTLSTHA